MSKKAFSTILALVLCGALLLAGCGNSTSGGDAANNGGDGAGGSDEDVLVLSFASILGETEHDVSYYSVQTFMDKVEELSGGTMRIEYFSNGTLGTEADLIDQVHSGSLDLAMPTAAVASTSGYPEFIVYALPFAWENIDDYWYTAQMGSEFYNTMRDVMDSRGQAHFISAFVCDLRGLQNNKQPIGHPDDFVGLTFRVLAGEINTDMYRALGASTASIAYSELYTSLQQGVIDGVDVGPSTFYTQSMHEVADYVTDLRMAWCTNFVMMSNNCWDSLTEEQRQIIFDAALEAEKVNCEKIGTGTDTWFDYYMDILEDAGCEVIRHHEITDEAMDAFRAATEEVWEKYADQITEPVMEVFQKSLDEIAAGAKTSYVS